MKTYLEQIKTKIEKQRIESKMQVTALSEKTGISRITYYRFIHKNSNISASQLFKILEALDLSVLIYKK